MQEDQNTEQEMGAAYALMFSLAVVTALFKATF